MNTQLEDRIKKLLAKAESTDSESEAAAFMAKAQELMVRYAIDSSDLREQDEDKIVEKTILIGQYVPGVRAFRYLLNRVAELNRCSGFELLQTPYHAVVGYREDVEFTEFLYNSLVTQLNSAMARAQKKPDIDFDTDNVDDLIGALREASENLIIRERTHGRTWKTSFTWGYVERVVKRLKEYHRKIEEQIRKESDSAIVLVDRYNEVKRWLEDMHPDLKNFKDSKNTDPFAEAMGYKAGANVDVSGGKRNIGGRLTLPPVN